MKKLITTTLIGFALLAPAAAISGHTAAVDVFQPCNGSAAGTDVCQDANGTSTQTNPIIKIIKAAIKVLSYIIGAAAIVGIVVSGIRMMAAGGDSQAVASARSALVYSLVGIAVAVLAQVLVAYVLDKVK